MKQIKTVIKVAQEHLQSTPKWSILQIWGN